MHNNFESHQMLEAARELVGALRNEPRARASLEGIDCHFDPEEKNPVKISPSAIVFGPCTLQELAAGPKGFLGQMLLRAACSAPPSKPPAAPAPMPEAQPEKSQKEAAAIHEIPKPVPFETKQPAPESALPLAMDGSSAFMEDDFIDGEDDLDPEFIDEPELVEEPGQARPQSPGLAGPSLPANMGFEELKAMLTKQRPQMGIGQSIERKAAAVGDLLIAIGREPRQWSGEAKAALRRCASKAGLRLETDPDMGGPGCMFMASIDGYAEGWDMLQDASPDQRSEWMGRWSSELSRQLQSAAKASGPFKSKAILIGAPPALLQEAVAAAKAQGLAFELLG